MSKPSLGRRSVLSVFGLALGLALGAPKAQAYATADRFLEPVGRGGGGGRYFTGSPVDGYACSVCHTGAPEPKVSVTGLPEDGYEPGRLYEIEIAWDNSNPMFRHALQLEFLGRDARAAGKLLLLDDRQIDARQRCVTGDKPPADYELDTPGGRKIVGIEPCGAGHLRFRYAPPETDDVAFAMSFVVSDRGGSVEGDGVFNYQRVLRRTGVAGPQQGCALSGTPAATSTALVSVLSLLGLSLIVRRRR